MIQHFIIFFLCSREPEKEPFQETGHTLILVKSEQVIAEAEYNYQLYKAEKIYAVLSLETNLYGLKKFGGTKFCNVRFKIDCYCTWAYMHARAPVYGRDNREFVQMAYKQPVNSVRQMLLMLSFVGQNGVHWSLKLTVDDQT